MKYYFLEYWPESSAGVREEQQRMLTDLLKKGGKILCSAGTKDTIVYIIEKKEKSQVMKKKCPFLGEL